MSGLPEDFTASVTNWKGTRTIKSSTQEILGEAQNISIGVIANVDTALQRMEDSGNNALEEATQAVAQLGRFSPSAINVSYSPPGIDNPGYLMPGPFSLTDSSSGVVVPPIGAVGLPLTDPGPPAIGGTPPVAEFVDFNDPPVLQTFYAPPIPSVGELKELGAPPETSFTEFATVMPTPPALRELVLPTFTPQPFPDYVDPFIQSLPPLPPQPHIDLDGLVAYTRLWGDAVINAVPSLGGVLVRDLVTQRDLRNSVETYRIRGCALDEDQEYAQIDYADEITRLMNQAESRQLIIDEGLNGAEIGRTQLRFAVQFQVMFLELAVAVAKVYFEARLAQAQALATLAHAMTAYYNALIAQYAADAEVYKTQIEEEVARLHYWQALVKGEVAKTQANAQLTSLYVQTEQVETIEADVYSAQVSAVLAQVERYRAIIEAIAAKAEVAKTSIAIYRGETEAYSAGVAAYKAHFDEYAARAKSASAQNAAQAQSSELSLALATQTAAQAQIISTNIEISAEQLRAQATKVAASYEGAKQTNAVEAIRTQIAASSGRITALRYTADQQVKMIPNEAAASYAQQATRYFSAASDAAYRASEQTLKAITAAGQAAAVAQEAAGRSSAALSQGALSAVHISAAMRGAGGLSGSEQHNARLDQSISDSLTYTESKSETLSA
jgi:hypothetical protein